MPNVHVTPIVGLPQFSGWSHVIEGTHSSPHRFVAVLAVSGRQASNIGRDAAALLLAQTINSAEELHSVVTSAIALANQVDCQLDIAAALISDSRTIFISKQASVFLRRGSKIGTIIQASDTLRVIEGKRVPDDVCVLATQQAGDFLGEIELKSKQGYDVDTIITSIVPGVHAQADSSLSAFAFISDRDAAEEMWDEAPDSTQEEEAEGQDEVVHADERTRSVESTSDQLQEATLEKSSIDNEQTASKKTFERIQNLLKFVYQNLRSFIVWFWLLLRWFSSNVKAISSYVLNSTDAGASDSVVEAAYVSPVRQRRKKIILGVSLLIFVGIIAAVFLWFQRRNSEIVLANSLVDPLRTELSNAQAQVESEPVAARSQVQAIIQDLEVLEAEHSGKSRMVAVFVAEKLKAQQVFESISGQESLETLPVYYDLRLVKSDFVSKLAAQVGEYAVFLDVEQKQVITLQLTNKEPKLVSIAQLGDVQAISGGTERILLLNSGVHELSLQAEASPETLKAEGDSTRGGTLIGSFDRFVYVFNPAKRNLYRYAEQGSGYSDPIGWLQVSKGLEYASVTSMAIDGDIWLGSIDGAIRKFTSGVEQDFVVSGLPEAFNSEIFLVTTADMENLYVLEPSKHRLVVLSKNGAFLRELSNQSLGAVNGLIVQESLGKAFAVSGATVFEVSI